MILEIFHFAGFLGRSIGSFPNGNIADGRIKGRDPVRKVEEFEESAGESDQGCSDLNGRLPNWEN